MVLYGSAYHRLLWLCCVHVVRQGLVRLLTDLVLLLKEQANYCILTALHALFLPLPLCCLIDIIEGSMHYGCLIV